MIRRHLLACAVGAPVALAARASSRPKVGLSLPLSGVQATVAAELRRGYELAFSVARDGGIDVDAVVIDDQSKPDLTAAAVRRFALDPSVIAASGIVGTPHAKTAIPVARDGGLPLVGIRSGAGELRDGGSLVYHLRASYEAELTRMVRTLAAAHRDIAILASNDAFGTAAAQHSVAECKAAGVSVAALVMAERNGSDVKQMTAKVLHEAKGATALLVLMITKPAIDAIRYCREHSFFGAVFTMSFTAGNELAAAGPNVCRGLGLVSAFPLPRAAHDDTSIRFRDAAIRSGDAGLADSLNAAEGFWYGTALTTALQRASGATSRSSLVAALESSNALRLGGQPLSFDGRRVGRQYLRVMHFDRDAVLRA